MLDSKRHAAAIAVSVAMLATGEHAVAQNTSELETRLEAGTLTSSRVGAMPLSAFALAPTVRYASGLMSTSVRGSAWLGANDFQLGDGKASLEAYTPLLYGVRAEIAANASRVFFDPTLQNDQIDAQGRLHLMRHRAGLWLGTGIAHPLHVAPVSNVNINSGGIWTKLGTATVRGSVTSFLFTKATSRSDTAALCSPIPPASYQSATTQDGPMASTAGCRQQSRLTDVEASVNWQHRLLEFTVRGGQRFGDPIDVTPESRQWASAQAAVWITGQLAAVAGGGHEPAQPTRGLPARSYGSFGLMLAYWPIPRGTVPVETPASLVHMFELRPAGAALQRLTARIGGVETVEVMGDFTDWTPLQLTRRGRDLWELLILMKPGVHQINLRIDGGEWIAPPGVPAIKDGFNGEVGVLVIKP